MKQISLLLMLFIAGQASFAQCPGCVPFDCSSQNPDGGLCDTIVIGMANHALDEKISFYMPKKLWRPEVPPNGGFVDLDRIQITGVIGLPLGLNWESNRSPNDEYFPSSGDTTGCVRLCGVPLQADTFPLTVYLLADVTAMALGQTITVKNQSQTYDNAVIIILPDTAGGVSSFSVTPNITSNCDPLSLSFEALIDGSPNPTEYSWDFGNGNTANKKNPVNQVFSSPQVYPVSLTTTIKAYIIREFKVLTASGWYPDIEEVTALQAPDLYFKLPSLGYQSPEKTETQPVVTWSNLHIVVPIGMDSIDIEVWDADSNVPIFGSADDLLAVTKIRLSVNQLAWSGSNAAGFISISDTIGNQFSETLDVTIGAIPDATVTAMKGDSICANDSTALVLSGNNMDNVIWFKDSVLIPNANDTFFVAKETGVYYAEITSSLGCRGSSDQKSLKVFSLPSKPVIFYSSANNELFTNNAATASYLQWFIDGDSVSGATGTSLAVSMPGTYELAFANDLGCTALSDPFSITGMFNEHLFSHELKSEIYPNPNNGVFILKITPANTQDITVNLYDPSGKRILSDRIGIISSSYEKKYHLSDLPEGVYFLQLLSEKSKIMKKLVLFE